MSDNLEAPHRAAELALLYVWDMLRDLLPAPRSKPRDELLQVFQQLVELYLTIAADFIANKIAPHAEHRDALASAVGGGPLDVNLALFDVIGRIALAGVWTNWLLAHGGAASADREVAVDIYIKLGLDIIANNSALTLPISDEQATSITLFLVLCGMGSANRGDVRPWIDRMIGRYIQTITAQKIYPTCKTEYRELLAHPVDRGAAYFREATAAGTLAPLLSVWATAMGLDAAAQALGAMARSKLGHSTLQLWTVDDASEAHLYINSDVHGRAIVGLPIDDGAAAIAMLEEVRSTFGDYAKLSGLAADHEPVVLTACRHWRLPIPTEVYSAGLAAAVGPRATGGSPAPPTP